MAVPEVNIVDTLPEFLQGSVVQQVVEEAGSTPLQVYSRQTIERQAESVLGIDAPYGLTARYAMKANSHPKVLDQIRRSGLDIDASSGFEAWKAIKAGFRPDQIMITSQQIPDDLYELVDAGVHYNATSAHQLQTYCEMFPGTEVSVRINPGIENGGGNNQTSTAGLSSSFGIWHERIDDVLETAAANDVTITKLHTHIGSGTDPNVWDGAVSISLDIARKFPDVTTLNLGGGFKVGRMPGEPSADMAIIGKQVNRHLTDFAAQTGRELHLEVEPGTFLVAEAGALIARIIDIKDTGEKGYTFYVLDTGMNDHMRTSLYGAQLPLTVTPRDGSELPEPTQEVVVVGHNCESGDLFTPAKGKPEEIAPRLLGRASIGDLMVIGGTGAYGLSSMAAVGYNSYPSAKEIFI